MAKGEILYQGKIRISDPLALFSSYQVSDKDIKKYQLLIKEGFDEEAIDEFVGKYMSGPAELYTRTMQRYLKYAEQGQMERKEFRSMTTNIAILSVAMGVTFRRNFKNFTMKALAPLTFEKYRITSPRVKQVVLNETLAQFNTLTAGSMYQTQTNVLSLVRQMQKEMIIENQLIRTKRFIEPTITREIKRFKEGLRKKMPQYYSAMEEGKMLLDRNGNAWKLENYTEMSTSTTLLNVERTSVEVISFVDKRRVVEYYKRDDRKLKTGNERQICKDILRKKVQGKPLLALDEETAKMLGVITIDKAKAQTAMGPWCRHSIRPVSNTFHRKIEKIYFKEAK